MNWEINIVNAMTELAAGRRGGEFTLAEYNQARADVEAVLHEVTPAMIIEHANLEGITIDDDVSLELSYGGCSAAAALACNKITILSESGKRQRLAIDHFFG